MTQINLNVDHDEAQFSGKTNLLKIIALKKKEDRKPDRKSRS